MNATLNGNTFAASRPHMFVAAEIGAEVRGTYYPTVKAALESGTVNANSTGVHVAEVEINGATWYQATARNSWD
jgi:hypothetical protein